MLNEIFIGGREKGLLSLQALVSMKANVVQAYVLKEDDHEYEKFYPIIEEFCKNNNIPYILTKSVKERIGEVILLKPDLIIVSGWRTIIPKEIVEYPKYGCVTFHESLLPKYRGFAPINWAVINGEKKTGVTMFYLDKGVDTGDIIAQKEILIGENDTAYAIYKNSIKISTDLLIKYHSLLLSGKVSRKKQNEKRATYACSRTPDDGRIDFTMTTREVHNVIRGSSYPYPGAFCFHKGTRIVIQKATIPSQKKWSGSIPGRITMITPMGIEVLTGDGSIKITEVTIEGRSLNPSEYFKSVKEKFE